MTPGRTNPEGRPILSKTSTVPSRSLFMLPIDGVSARVRLIHELARTDAAALATCKPLSRMVEPNQATSMVSMQHVCRTLDVQDKAARASAWPCMRLVPAGSKPGVLNARVVQALYPTRGSCAEEKCLLRGGFGCG